ncbi:cell morphogenesis protein-like protein [Westerdykella ornata]|uniref:Cell morphogenesis protein-like protein n=1 Tax=Westerdykella ornata TaxID=318751 RepID=A0A6A6JAA3_WESOR|nr:cell morphogenesis protein-like protein [Westerdykella ornata]KAF2273521.1 cell morphogenesis protein-like protein [Westerdykella ornata]
MSEYLPLTLCIHHPSSLKNHVRTHSETPCSRNLQPSKHARWAERAASAATQALHLSVRASASSPLAHPSHHPPADSSSVPPVPPSGPPAGRGRALTASGPSASPRSQTPVVVAPSSHSSPDGNSTVERKHSLSYGHHRQTSIVHGIQHSRNTSFVNSPATSPLSPLPLPVITAGNASPDGTAMTQDSPSEAFTAGGVHVAVAGLGNAHSSAVTSSSTAPRKPERVHSGRRKEHHHQRSQSRHPQGTNEVRTMSEYAMTHLFHEFNIQADHKIAQCLDDRNQQDIYPERACGPGVDPSFDQLLSALGHIARHKPKSLIDTMMFWRKAKSEAAAEHRTRLANAKKAQVLPTSVLPRRNTEPLHVASDGQTPITQAVAQERSIVALQHATWQYEQRSTISTYILCRVLIEIISQTDLQSLTQDMAERLLGIFYAQLNTVDPDEADDSPLHHANWVMYVELLGVLSDLIFDKIQEKFIADLQTLEGQLSAKGQANRDLEGKKAALLVRSMRRLRVKSHPGEAWAQTCDCMLSLAKLFANAHGQMLKYAYCQVLRELLQRIASKPAFDPNSPKWRAVVETMRPRLALLLSKPKHWQEAFPLMVSLLCVSPTESFVAQWSSLALSIQPRLKERATRAVALRGLCQLVWTYIYRTTVDSPSIVVRKLDEIVRMVFQPGRRSYLSTDQPIADPLIQLTRIIGFKYQDLCFKAIIFPLLNSEMFASGRDLRVENMEPDRMVIGIRSFLAIMADLEKGERPPFPCTSDTETPGESIELPPPPASPRGPQQLPIKSSLLKEERLSRPVNFSGFAEVAKEYYVRFCKILGEITIICDNAFGGQAVLDEKFSLQTPKTPMSDAFSFTRRDDQGSTDPRQGFYGLLHVAVQALPRCLSPHIPFNSLINLLCTGTAHVQRDIAASSVQSLKSIARQSHAQQVTIGFARFIFNFDDRYATMSDGGMLGPGHIESTLKLYVELLQIWIEEIKEKTRKAALDTPDDGISGNRGAQLDLSSVWAHVDEIESHGLFFLCSPSRRVRWYAVTVLRLITEFDKALGGSSTRIIRVMEGSPQRVMDISHEKLSLAERSRLQRGMRKSNVQSTLVELCSSDVPYDSTLWFKIFPNLVRISFEVCPFAVTLTRDIVCARLTQMHRTLHSLIEGPRGSPYPTFDSSFGKISGRLASTSPDIVIEQWKLYLIFAFTTLTNLGSAGQANLRTQPVQHSRKSSKSSQKSASKVYTAGELFAKVLPFLSVDNAAVRDAAVVGLGSININLYRSLLEALQGHALACAEEAKTRLGMHTRTVSSPRRSRRTDHLRTEITHVYKLTSHFLKMPEAYNDDWILNNVVNYTKDLRIFLSDAEVQNEWGFQKLRTHYCGLVEVLFEGINMTKDPLQWMPFQARKAAFTLMEEWCGYSANQQQIRQREENMRRSMLDRESDLGNKGIATAAMEIEKRDLRTAALSAMAALCAGPVSITTDSKVLLQFDVRRMLSWIDSIFETPSDRTHAIGRRALTNLIIHNREHPYLLDRAIEMCYLSKSSKSLESYFEVVTRVLTEREDYTLPFWKVLSAGLYTLGHENNGIRMKSARLLRTLEAREQKNSKLQDLDISISDKTIAVYKLAQFETSRRLAKQHSELAFMVFSQFSYYFKELQPDHQRNMVAAMLPWVQTVELQINPEGGPTANSYMLLVNLFEITVRCSNALHNEIQALWQALATGPYAGNVQLILNFFINLCLDKREQNYVDVAKQIVVHLSSTPAGLKVVEFLLLHINPRSMVVEKREPSPPPPDAVNLPYLADLDALLPTSGNKHSGFALGQICLILLVDLMVSPVQLASEHVPLLLQVVMVLWDHYIPVVQDQAREMLVHLIHELVISKIDDETVGIDKRAIEDFVESVRRHDAKVVWNYDDKSAKDMTDSGSKVLESMSYVAGEVLKFFSITYPGFREAWGKVALNWATSCSVRHVACRSFQLFRCILSSLDQQMLADMLARLSNTVSDSESDIQTFSLEILTTLRAIIEALQPEDLIQYPQLFWATCACLDTIHESEFMESMLMLDKLLDKIDLGDPDIIQILEDNFPDKWSGQFQGLSQLVYKGVRSSICLDRSLRLLERLVEFPSSRIVGDHGRLVYTVLANMPRFLQSFDQSEKDMTVSATATVLARVAEGYNCPDLFEALTAFANRRYRYDKDFVAQTMSAIRLAFFPEFEYGSLVFLLSLLTNKLDWMKINTMEVLCFIIPEIDMRKPEITSKGSDLISPLLRLLHNEYCPQALKVLDSIMDMAGEANALENQHLRMSMAGGHSTRATRKQYAQTQSLYGIPEESGWSVPIPDHHAQLTRANVHAVFYTCGTVEDNDATQVDTPKIEFRQEEILFSPISDYRTATMTSEDTRGDSHIGELVMKLDSLDDFFEEDDDDTETLTDLPNSSMFGHGRYVNGSYASVHPNLDARENLYDQRTAPILHKSLTRNASVSSFHYSSFADMELSPSRDPGVMTPGAFTSFASMAPAPSTSTRPGLHSRSVTSPSASNQYQRQSPGLSSAVYESDNAFSDDDLAAGRSSSSNPSEKGPSFEHVVRPPRPTDARSRFRSGVRRLTGGGGDAREREKAREAIKMALQKSPEVPKVPDIYLVNPRSADP